MIDYNLISTIGNVDADVEKQLSEAFGNSEQDKVMDTVLGGEVSNTAAPGGADARAAAARTPPDR